MTNDDPLDEFLRQQAAPPPVIHTTPPTSQRIIITRLHLHFGDVFRFTLQMTAASPVIGVGLWVVTFLLMICLKLLAR